MKFISTRGKTDPVGFSEAVAMGLAPDGGLFLPETLPDIAPRLEDWKNLSYPELTAAFFELFSRDREPEKLREMMEKSYRGFDHPKIAPLQKLGPRLYLLELFHGPTLAFKDFALQVLGNLYEDQIRLTGKPLNVLGATSGDTGAAAIHGLLGKAGINIFILYPEGRISDLQERQMTCTGAANVFPLAIKGSFDDAQRALKETFEDLDFRDRYGLSAVNSINLARIIAQCVYYIYAWFQVPAADRHNLEFVVPTGNFGNILAGWLVRKMGLPAAGFKVSTNQNDILYRFFRTGVYQIGEVQPSFAPSMDIQVASNFERFIYYAVRRETGLLRQIMEKVKNTGHFRIEHFNPDIFTASRTSDEEIPGIIKKLDQRCHYLVDPHTACAFKDLDESKTNLVLATAHPAKFPDTIIASTGKEPRSPMLDALKEKEIVKYRIPAAKSAIQEFIKKYAKS